MEKVKKYKKIILKILKDYQEYISSENTSEVKNQLIVDDKNNHFQLVTIGWEGKKYFHTCVVHFDIIDGKIWLQQNITEREFAEDLFEMGVPKSDIVIGFVKPSLRKYSNYSTA